MLGRNALNYNKLKDERVVLDQIFLTSSFFSSHLFIFSDGPQKRNSLHFLSTNLVVWEIG